MPLDSPDQIIKVRPDSNVKKVAGAILHEIDETGESVVQAIGQGAVNQATKSIIIAREKVASKGKDLWCRMGFLSVPGNRVGQTGDITVIVWYVESR